MCVIVLRLNLRESSVKTLFGKFYNMSAGTQHCVLPLPVQENQNYSLPQVGIEPTTVAFIFKCWLNVPQQPYYNT